LLAGVAGCARAHDAAGGPAYASDAPSTDADGLGNSCTTSPFAPPSASPDPASSGQPMPADFVPVSATRCLYPIVTVPGNGSWLVRVQQRATGDGLAELARALRLPSILDNKVACAGVGREPIVLTLTDGQGHTVIPQIPHTACGDPLPDVVQAIHTLPWQETSRTNVQQVQSQLEVASGCSGRYKPVIALYASDRNLHGKGDFTKLPPGTVRICRYRLDPGDTMTGDDNTGAYQTGVLDTAGTLDGSVSGHLLTALAAAPPAKPCTAQAPFTVLSPDGAPGPVVYVELGGCYRAADENGNLRQLDAATVALLTK
jgi:hypothetical protein